MTKKQLIEIHMPKEDAPKALLSTTQAFSARKERI
jgi:TPP-dependent 2-oxoacid decarboxylase